jgi:hypothetical protein
MKFEFVLAKMEVLGSASIRTEPVNGFGSSQVQRTRSNALFSCLTAGVHSNPAACKIQQIYKRVPHRNKFVFGFSTPAKRPLERNKRHNKPEQAKEQARRGVRVSHQTKTPGATIPAGRTS